MFIALTQISYSQPNFKPTVSVYKDDSKIIFTDLDAVYIVRSLIQTSKEKQYTQDPPVTGNHLIIR